MDFEILSANNEYLYLNNKPISKLNNIFPEVKANQYRIVWIYNMPNRRFLFEMSYGGYVEVEEEMNIELKFASGKQLIIKQIWGIFYLEDNTVAKIDINKIVNNPKRIETQPIEVSQHPSQNGIYIVKSRIANNLYDKDQFSLLIVDGDDIITKDLIILDLYKTDESLLGHKQKNKILFSSSSNLKDYIVVQKSIDENITTILNTNYKGSGPEAYININEPLIIIDKLNRIDIYSLSKDKIIKSFDKWKYRLYRQISYTIVGDDKNVMVAITGSEEIGNLLLLEFSESDIKETKSTTNIFNVKYIDFYGFAAFKSTPLFKLVYQLFNGEEYQIKGSVVAANHELYEAKLKELIAETEIYLPLQNIIEEYL